MFFKAPAGYTLTRTGRFYAVAHADYGVIADDCECVAQAEAVADEHADTVADAGEDCCA